MLILPESLTIFNGEHVLDELTQYINTCIDEQGTNAIITLDAGKLNDIDGAGLQILLSVYKTYNARNVNVQLIGAGDELRRVFEITGVQEIMGAGNVNE